MNIKSKDFTLVLSGGGALGIAHLGVLSDLEDESITPSEIVGTSMGAIIGACFAIGMREKERVRGGGGAWGRRRGGAWGRG